MRNRRHARQAVPVPSLALALTFAGGCASHERPASTPVPSLADLQSRADHNDPAAQIALGERYFNGDGVKIDEPRAARLFQQAADQGSALGRTRLADCYISGRGVPIDTTRAAALYARAAESEGGGGAHGGGLPEAQFALGNCYEKGIGVAKDLPRAAVLWTRAADNGFAPAQFRLGLYYKSNESGAPAPDLTAAAGWFERAARQGHAGAQANLARCYQKGEGKPKDPEAAYTWSLIAMSNGAPLAQRVRDAVAKDLTPGQIAEAQRRAAGFTPLKPETPQILLQPAHP